MSAPTVGADLHQEGKQGRGGSESLIVGIYFMVVGDNLLRAFPFLFCRTGAIYGIACINGRCMWLVYHCSNNLYSVPMRDKTAACFSHCSLPYFLFVTCSCCLEAPLHCTVKMAGGATVRLGCRKEHAKKASPAPPSAMLSLKLVLKAGPSLKSDLLIAAPPYAADLFLVCAFRVLHWVFRLHRFLFQAIVQLRSPTFIPPQLPPPLPSPSGSLPPAPWRSTSSLRFPPLPPPSPGTTLPPKVIT